VHRWSWFENLFAAPTTPATPATPTQPTSMTTRRKVLTVELPPITRAEGHDTMSYPAETSDTSDPADYVRDADDLPESESELESGYDAEIVAMATVIDALESLSLGGQRRVLTYLYDRFLNVSGEPAL
jgi:hypothetical protein